jgi:hypothetical protein
MIGKRLPRSIITLGLGRGSGTVSAIVGEITTFQGVQETEAIGRRKGKGGYSPPERVYWKPPKVDGWLNTFQEVQLMKGSGSVLYSGVSRNRQNLPRTQGTGIVDSLEEIGLLLMLSR